MEGYEPASPTQAELLKTSPDRKRAFLSCWAKLASNAPDHPMTWALHDCCAQYLAADDKDHRLLTEVTFEGAQGRSEQLSSRVEFAYAYYDPLFSIATAPVAPPKKPSRGRRGRKPLAESNPQEFERRELAKEAWQAYSKELEAKENRALRKSAEDQQAFYDWVDELEVDRYSPLLKLTPRELAKTVDRAFK